MYKNPQEIRSDGQRMRRTGAAIVFSMSVLAGYAGSGGYARAPIPTGSELILHEHLELAHEPARVCVSPERRVVDGGRAWSEPARMAPDRDSPHAPRRYEFHTRVEIRSDRLPQIDSLHCSHEEWHTGNVPSLHQIERALGEKMSVQSPEGNTTRH